MADCVMRSAVRLNLAISQLPEALAAHDYDLQEPPDASASWVDELCGRANLLKDRLEQVSDLDQATNMQASLSPLKPRSSLPLASQGFFLGEWNCEDAALSNRGSLPSVRI